MLQALANLLDGLGGERERACQPYTSSIFTPKSECSERAFFVEKSGSFQPLNSAGWIVWRGPSHPFFAGGVRPNWSRMTLLVHTLRSQQQRDTGTWARAYADISYMTGHTATKAYKCMYVLAAIP